MRPATLITTVVTPAPDTDLTDLSTFKNEIGGATTFDDAFLSRQISVASTQLQTYCNRIFAVQTIQDQFWLARDSWPRVVRDEVGPLQLSAFPPAGATAGWALSVTSVVETIAGVSTTLVEGTDFLVDATNAQLIRLNVNGYPRHWAASPIVAIYTAGYSPIPDDAEEAALLLVKLRWFARTRDPMIREENASGVYQAQYWFATGPGGAGDMPPDVMAMVDRYRVPVVG